MEPTDNHRQSLVDQQLVQKHLSSRTVKNKVFKLIFLACTLLGLVVLIALLTQTLIKGVSHLNLQFFTNFSSSTPSMAGVKGALIGSLWLMLSIIPLSIILGIGTAIYLEEYAKNNKFTQFVKISISNLAGVPSVVFGLLGYTLFVGGAGIEALKMGNSILATPRSILDQFSALPIQIFTWAKMPQEEFQNVASAGIIVLLVILILMNGVAIILRNKFSKKF
ncbi:TPA: hypothetical protein PJ663_002130 [Staphylococcus aureus]|nr:hypothetical protein [Staphylococcus aureus]